MSIEGKHAYRFVYLKSDQWKTVRLEALAREKGKCQLCGEESVFNDAHHIWYPDNIYDTTEKHLAVLCRDCHDFTHAMLLNCKTKDEEEGRAQWNKFLNAVVKWKIAKQTTLTSAPPSFRELRRAYESLKSEKVPVGKLDHVLEAVRRLSEHLEKFQKAVDSSLE